MTVARIILETSWALVLIALIVIALIRFYGRKRR
jgi:hypothetical protein